MIARLYNALFGCWPHNWSRPFTPKPGTIRPEAACVTGTYVVCLECGTERPYCLHTMRVLSWSRRKKRTSVEVGAVEQNWIHNYLD